MANYNFLRTLHIETSLSWGDANNLVEFFENNGDLDKAILIYNNYGFKGLMEYKNVLIQL